MRGRKIYALVFFLLMFVTPLTTFAKDDTTQVQAELITDQESYSVTDTITATLRLDNQSSMDFEKVSVSFTPINGYKMSIKEGKSELTTSDLTSYIATYVPDKESIKANNTNTGDKPTIFLYLLIIIIAIFVIIGIFYGKKKNRILSLFLSFCLILSCIPVVGLTAKAADERKITKTIRVGSVKKEIEVKYQCHAKDNITPQTVTVKFESNGGSKIESQTIPYGSALTVPEQPVKNSYTFVGWYLDKQCKYLYNFKDYIPQQDGTLYARWINLDDSTDSDGDGILNSFEDLFGTDLNKADTDGDGLPDAYELEPLGLDPTNSDTNGNGINDSDEDMDQDGLNNLEEYQLGTKPGYVDSDNDGLSDYEEIKQYHTDPLNADTDGDGAFDGTEISIGTDPLIVNESFNTSVSTDGSDGITGVTANVNLPGDQVDSLKINQNESLLFPDDMPGYIGPAYDFGVDDKINSAVLKFSFDKSLMNDPSFDPVVYYMNAENGQMEALDTEIDKENGIATAATSHFSTYILLNRTAFATVWRDDIRKPSDQSQNGLSIAFVLDRSASMTDNDPKGLRLTLSKQFVDKMTEGRDSGALVSFIAKDELITPLTDNLDELKQSLDKFKNDDGYNADSGTNGAAAIHTALQQLEGDASGNDRVILFMTDGDDNRVSYSYDDLIAEANENRVTIYTIGLGNVNSSILEKVADGTGGKYYYAEAAEDLDTIFKDAEKETIDFTMDSNNDGISNYYTKILCEGEKYINGTENPFSGLKYEDVQANGDYDGDGLLNGEEYLVNTDDSEFIQFCMKSNPTKEDTDNDGLLDGGPQRLDDGTEVAPKDPAPMEYTGKRNVWKQHVNVQFNAGTSATDENKPISTEYGQMLSLKGELPGQFEQVYNFVEVAAAKLNDWTIDVDYRDKALPVIKGVVMAIKYWATVFPVQMEDNLKQAVKENSEILKTILGKEIVDKILTADSVLTDTAYTMAILGGAFLNFVPDNYNVALHSQPATWQRSFGYNDLYDLVFESGSDMKKEYYESDNDSYRIWLWKGDYWNLRSGAEVGIYVKNMVLSRDTKTPVFDAVDFEIPIHVSLYNYEKNNIRNNIFNWFPSVSQWWGTGFNWRFINAVPDDMILVESLCFMSHIELYDSFKTEIKKNHPADYENKFVFDDITSTIWIQW